MWLSTVRTTGSLQRFRMHETPMVRDKIDDKTPFFYCSIGDRKMGVDHLD